MQATNLAVRLRAYYPKDDLSRQQALRLAMEILLSPPVVTACGIFDVNLKIISTVLYTHIQYIYSPQVIALIGMLFLNFSLLAVH